MAPYSHNQSATPCPCSDVPGALPNTSSGSRPFGIHVTRMHGSGVVIAVTGAVDSTTVDALRAAALEEIAAGARRLVLDLSSLDFWNLNGMGAVAAAYRSATHVGASVALAGLSPTLEKRYRLTGMDKVVPLHRDVCAALAP
ncbi:STAS domain-containing protein [Streptomyces sp. NBC_00316]|uniref:STAS domain-containing protein n=1 Tax=Streptomyces sp. NBC_00316 TaxID=2975710 RepID=UPI002E2E37A6|nr:STAS domain-containing protein [Streptomyces sp. NBC_00316]